MKATASTPQLSPLQTRGSGYSHLSVIVGLMRMVPYFIGSLGPPQGLGSATSQLEKVHSTNRGCAAFPLMAVIHGKRTARLEG
jgi:hypothetical protein